MSEGASGGRADVKEEVESDGWEESGKGKQRGGDQKKLEEEVGRKGLWGEEAQVGVHAMWSLPSCALWGPF